MGRTLRSAWIETSRDGPRRIRNRVALFWVRGLKHHGPESGNGRIVAPFGMRGLKLDYIDENVYLFASHS